MVQNGRLAVLATRIYTVQVASGVAMAAMAAWIFCYEYFPTITTITSMSIGYWSSIVAIGLTTAMQLYERHWWRATGAFLAYTTVYLMFTIKLLGGAPLPVVMTLLADALDYTLVVGLVAFALRKWWEARLQPAVT